MMTTILTDLAKYDTPTISNSIELFQVRPHSAGYTNHAIRCCFERLPPMVGYACTATYRASAPPASDGASKSGCASKAVADLVALFAALPGPPVVVFQDLDEPPAAASVGEVACWTYKSFGAAGMITSGAARDLEQVEALDFPIFAGSAICSHGYGHLTSIGRPVEVGGLTIRQGDLLHGDRNGIVLIPHKIAGRVAQVAAAIVEAEKPVIHYLKTSKRPTVEGYRAVIREMQAVCEEVRTRIVAAS